MVIHAPNTTPAPVAAAPDSTATEAQSAAPTTSVPPRQAPDTGSASRSATARRSSARTADVNPGSGAEVDLKETDDRFTSPEFVRAVETVFGRIDFDPCWHEASVTRPRAHFDVRKGDDGLRDAWSGRLAFVNPPWSAQAKWLERGHGQWRNRNVGTVIFLVPAKTDTVFFHETVASEADVYFVRGRPRFFKSDGTSESTMVSVMVVMFGATNEQRQRFAELVRGSWWVPSRAASVQARRARTHAPMMLGAMSCAPAPTGVRGNPVVTCGPLGGRDRPVTPPTIRV